MKKPKLRYNVDGCKDTPFGKYIRQRMRDLDMSPGELARDLEVSMGRVSQLFTSYVGDKVPTTTSLVRLARVLKTEPEVLLMASLPKRGER